jgi:hypothetical protein
LRGKSNNPVPQGMRVQLARLFGSSSAHAEPEFRSNAEWRKTLLKVLGELNSYLLTNVQTDAVHLSMLFSGLYAAHESLNCEEFWPGYAEGITRLALLLMGDYPDHRRRKGGRKEGDHYQLSRSRSLNYTQTYFQKLQTLLIAPALGIKLNTLPHLALRDFRERFGSKPGYDRFFKWYRREHPEDYSAVF